jgi:hypothetical protein
VPAIDTALPILWLREWLSEQHSGKLGGARCYVMTQLKHTMCVVIGGVVRAHSTPCHSFMGYVARALILRADETGRSRRTVRSFATGQHTGTAQERESVVGAQVQYFLVSNWSIAIAYFFSMPRTQFGQTLPIPTTSSRVQGPLQSPSRLVSGFTCLQLYYVARKVRAGGPRWLSSFTGIVFNFNPVLWVNLMSDTGAE